MGCIFCKRPISWTEFFKW